MARLERTTMRMVDSFEGDVSYVRSPAYSPRSERTTDEDRSIYESVFSALDEPEWISPYEECDMAGGEEDGDRRNEYHLYDYSLDTRPIVPRQAELASVRSLVKGESQTATTSFVCLLLAPGVTHTNQVSETLKDSGLAWPDVY